MARVPPAREPLAAAAREELERQRAAHGRVTNMKQTLAHSPVALSALMTWYPLRDECATFLGDRLTVLFAHAVSTEADCLICSTFMRRILIDAGDDPDHLQLDEREQAVVDFGLTIARNNSFVPAAIYDRVAALFQPAQIVTLTAFGALMIATNVFNNALEVELDEYLWPYRRAGSVK